MAQLGLVGFLQAEQNQVDGRGVVGGEVVVGAVVHRVPRKLPHAELADTFGETQVSIRHFLWGVTFERVRWDGPGRTVDAGVLDVDGLGGLIVRRGRTAVDRREDLQDAFGEAGLEHHAATADTDVLTARVQVGDTHRD